MHNAIVSNTEYQEMISKAKEADEKKSKIFNWKITFYDTRKKGSVKKSSFAVKQNETINFELKNNLNIFVKRAYHELNGTIKDAILIE